MLPQHFTVPVTPSLRRPQVNPLPAASCVNHWPAGCGMSAGAWPLLFVPQQTTSPLVRTAQLWTLPGATSTKVPDGAPETTPKMS